MSAQDQAPPPLPIQLAGEYLHALIDEQFADLNS
jgi:hypothetical protein